MDRWKCLFSRLKFGKSSYIRWFRNFPHFKWTLLLITRFFPTFPPLLLWNLWDFRGKILIKCFSQDCQLGIIKSKILIVDASKLPSLLNFYRVNKNVRGLRLISSITCFHYFSCWQFKVELIVWLICNSLYIIPFQFRLNRKRYLKRRRSEV